MSTNVSSTPHNLFSTPDLKSQINRTPKGDVLLSHNHSPFIAHELIETARALVNPRGKGIYATDESPHTVEAMLRAAAGETDHKHQSHLTKEQLTEKRRKWRETCYNSLSNEYIAGVIMYPESILDFKLAPVLTAKGIIPGVRAHGELRPIPSSQHEFVVEGLDGLLSMLQVARAAGARFSKWRVQIACTANPNNSSIAPSSTESVSACPIAAVPGLPSLVSLEIQAETLAQYASISQEAGLVPIVEPDVEFSEDADLIRSAEVHERAIAMIFERCRAHGVLLEGTLLKPSFPQPGLKHPSRNNITPEEIALATATVLSRSVPPAVPGVVFLSGGLTPTVVTSYLTALNALVNNSPPPSPFSRLPALSYSFGRALQDEAMKAYVKGDEKGVKDAYSKWSKNCGLATQGKNCD